MRTHYALRVTQTTKVAAGARALVANPQPGTLSPTHKHTESTQCNAECDSGEHARKANNCPREIGATSTKLAAQSGKDSR